MVLSLSSVVAARMMMTAQKITTRAMPIQPMMMPAIAMPRPPCVPPDSSICRRDMYPKTSARIDATPQA
jgi:hypothetical protein